MLKADRRPAPLFRGDVGDGLSEVPTVTGKVLGVVLAFAIDVVDGLSQDSGTVPTRPFAVRNGVLYADLDNVRVVGGDVAFGNRNASLTCSHLDSVVSDAEADREAEGGAKPVGRDPRIGILEDGDDGAGRHGTIREHEDTLPMLRTAPSKEMRVKAVIPQRTRRAPRVRRAPVEMRKG